MSKAISLTESDPVRRRDCWHRVHPVSLRGVIRSRPEDFEVDEQLSFELDGDGEFALLQVRKRGANTDYVAQALARFAEVGRRAVTYAGRKDRHAVTRQWFCVHLPGRPDPDWRAFAGDEWRVETSVRHRRKLRRGAIAENRFRIVIREVAGAAEPIDAVLRGMAQTGVPNYFGSQRFGRGGANLDRAGRMAGGERLRRNPRSMALSAARAFLFNEVLSSRVEDGSWNRPMDGDVWMFADGRTVFGPEPADGRITERCRCREIDPTGPLWGRGSPPTDGPVRELEQVIADRWTTFSRLVADAGMKQERRRLRLNVRDLDWNWLAGNVLELRFGLESGAFATSVLRELGDITDRTG